MDLNRLALNPTLRRLSAMLWDGYGLHCGFVQKAGRLVPLNTVVVGREKSLFDHLVAGVLVWDIDGRPVTAHQYAMQWARRLIEEGESARSFTVVMDVGFSALLLPVLVEDEVVLGIYIAGFVPAENAAAAIRQIQAHIPAELAAALKDEEGARIVQLNLEERRGVQILGSGMVQEVLETLDASRYKQQPLEASESTRLGDMLGASPNMQRLFGMVQRVARSNSTVLIEGENGTGKELVARAIHQNSRRADAPYIAVNCAAIPGELIASELFGHVRGAFSGAHKDRAGLFEAAHGGTLLLDEIGDMDLSLQVKLLRVLQEGTFLRVGDSQLRKVDVRVLCATNCDLKKMVAEGTFREDLYYRIKVISLHVPALRERASDIPLLANAFIHKAAHKLGRPRRVFSDACLARMQRYPWPGNVRELENEVERMVIMSGDDEVIDVDLLSPWISGRAQEDSEVWPAIEGLNLPEAVELLERRMIAESLRKTGGNKSQTARELGVSRRNLIRKVAQYELEEKEERLESE